MFVLKRSPRIVIIAGVAALLAVGGMAVAQLNAATNPDPAFLPSLPKQTIVGEGGPLITRPAAGASRSQALTRQQAEAVALKLWPDAKVIESGIAQIDDDSVNPPVHRPLWVVSLQFPCGINPIPDLGATGPAAGPARLAKYFYQLVDGQTGKPLWAQTSSKQ